MRHLQANPHQTQLLNWLLALQGLISGGKESKRHLDKKMADYTAASTKHLHPRPTRTWRRGEDAEKIHSDMIAAQVCRVAGKERKGKERKGKERKGKERKGKERKGKERKGKDSCTCTALTTIGTRFGCNIPICYRLAWPQERACAM